MREAGRTMERMDSSRGFFVDAGDGAMATMNRELQEMKRSTKRCQRLLAGLLLLLSLVTLALIITVGVQSHKISGLQSRQGIIPHQNVSFASNSGDKSVYGLTYGGSLFRGSGFWAQKRILPGYLTDHAAIGVDDQVYIIGGANENGTVLDQCWRYDSIFHNYSVMENMPQPRYRFGAALDGNKIYVAGGLTTGDECALSTFTYDLETRSWAAPGPAIPKCQRDNCAAAISGKVYSFGGYDENYKPIDTTQIYDTETGTWTSGPPMPTARGDAMCAAFDGELYVVGGYEVDNAFSAKVESLNPNTSTWTTQPSMLTPRGDAAIAVLDGGRLMVTGGEGHYKDDDLYKYPNHVNEVFYVQDKTWVEKAMIPTARFRAAAATVGGAAFVFGGADVCILTAEDGICPPLNVTEVYMDLDHPHVYVYLKDEAYNDNAALTTYPLS